MKNYPEHEKLKSVQEESQIIGEFLEWANEAFENIHEVNPNKVLAMYFNINLGKIEQEKQQMLEELKNMNN